MTLTTVQRRLLNASTSIMGEDANDLAFLHVVMSQVCLPYRDVPSRDYVRRTARASLVITAGFLSEPKTGEPVLQGLPYGAKPRLLMLHLCTQAVRRQSPVIEVADSMSGFMRQVGIAVTGGTHGSIARFKVQLNRLAAARMQFFMDYGDSKRTMNPAPMIREMDVWFPTDPRQRIIWPSEVRLSSEFFASLRENALPLNPEAFGALQHSARALDIYTWLAHRLPRVRETNGVSISWKALQEQFAPDLGELRDVRRKMLGALRQVLSVYPAARVEQVPGGIRLHRSAPPIRPMVVPGARLQVGDKPRE